MKQTRNKHSPAFKAKVALAALAGEEPSPSWPADLRSIPVRFTPGKGPWWKEPRSYLRFEVHPSQIHAWKRALVEGAPELLPPIRNPRRKPRKLRLTTSTGTSAI